jgi:hypothetical protein
LHRADQDQGHDRDRVWTPRQNGGARRHCLVVVVAGRAEAAAAVVAAVDGVGDAGVDAADAAAEAAEDARHASSFTSMQGLDLVK